MDEGFSGPLTIKLRISLMPLQKFLQNHFARIVRLIKANAGLLIG